MRNNSVDEHLKNLKPEQLASLLEANSLGYWVIKDPGIILEGRPLTFKDHEYLYDLYFDESRDIVIQKAAQMGYSTWATLATFHFCQYQADTGALYLLPTRDDVTEFSKARFKLIIDENPRLKDLVRDTDSANIKNINGKMAYFRGTKSRTSLKSIPVDRISLDERDEMDQRQVDLAMYRIGHSRFKQTRSLSTPSIPEEGINRLFLQSDQKQWFLKCQSCGTETCVEMEFPNCIELRAGKYVKVCKNCAREIFTRDGRWIAQNPGVEISGYHISQLNSAYASIDELMDRFRRGDNLEEVYQSGLGLPYIEADRRLEVKDVLACCGWHVNRLFDNGPCSMGVDQGGTQENRKYHVVVGKKRSSEASEIVHIGNYNSWEQINELMRNFRVMCCVADGLPDTDGSQRFANDWPGRVFLRMAYARAPMGGPKWDEMDNTILINRTEMLDRSHNEILLRAVTLPRRNAIIEEFARHCHMIAKIIEEEIDTGLKKPVWKKMHGPDHYRQAFAFESLARTRIIEAESAEKIYSAASYKPFDEVVGY